MGYGHIATASANGTPMKGGAQRRIAITFSEKDFEAVKQIAVSDERSINQTVIRIIREAIAKAKGGAA